jgi:hypothetical protein
MVNMGNVNPYQEALVRTQTASNKSSCPLKAARGEANHVLSKARFSLGQQITDD